MATHLTAKAGQDSQGTRVIHFLFFFNYTQGIPSQPVL